MGDVTRTPGDAEPKSADCRFRAGAGPIGFDERRQPTNQWAGCRAYAHNVSQPGSINTSTKFDRLDLGDGSWVDVARAFVSSPEDLVETLLRDVDWRPSHLFRYDHFVEEKRLGASWRPGTPLPHPLLADATRAIQHRYRVQFAGFGMIQYRDGGDGQAFHRDTDMRWLDDTIVAVLTLGATRPWLLRPKTKRHDHGETKGATHDLQPGSGDLIVMGGTCQSSWEHSVPYLLGRQVGVRLSIQWRFAHRRGRPFQGGSYRAPLTYSDQRRY